MRYSSIINNVKALEWGLTLQQAYLFAWFYELPSWADKVVIGNDIYYFASKNKAVEELPILTSKKDTMYRYYKQLEVLGLVVIKKIDTKDYITITNKGKQWNYSKSESSEINPSNLGQKSETPSDKNPTNNNIISNPIIKENNTDANAPAQKEPQEENDLFGKAPNPKKKTLFKNSLAFNYEIFEKKLSEAKNLGVDINYYYNAIKDWNDIKKVTRDMDGWIATARTFMRGDKNKGRLQVIKTEQQQAVIDSEMNEYLNM